MTGIKHFLALGAAGFLLAGCASSIPIQRETGQANFDYKVDSQSPETDKTISFVKPSFIATGTGDNDRNTSAQTILGQLAGNARQAPEGFDVQSTFNQSYASRLSTALANTFQEIVSARGFKTEGPYENFDEITYTNKKNHYLALLPDADLKITKKVNKFECKNQYCTEKGRITASGEFLLKAVEPMTQEALMVKRIHISDLGISEPYIQQFNYDPSGSSGNLVVKGIKSATSSLSAPEQLKDNTDKAMANAVTAFYKEAAQELDRFLSRGELLSFEESVEDLKSRKRY